jgi:GntR family transcriptional regulator/MocR family aminotransferase
MRPWDFAVPLDSAAAQPLYVQLARGISDAVRAGRLRPRDLLPGTRELAARLEVHRNTVIAAYRELQSEGWIETERARGTFVADALPEPSPARFAPASRAWGERAGFDLPTAREPYVVPPRRRGEISLQGGVPDTRLVPRAALGRALRRALRQGPVSLLDYGDPMGLPRLRHAIAKMLASRRGLLTGPEHVLITHGSQMALDLVARTLVSPGDRVAVEALGYSPGWEAFRRAGAVLVPVSVDAQGLDVDALRRLARNTPFRAVYLTPHHHFPTTVTLSPGRRMALLAWARTDRVALVEDDYDHEFHYDGRPILPLASADPAGVVVYIGTLSKLLAPGLRLGFVAAPTGLIGRLATERVFVDRHGASVVESAVADFIEEGELQRHARKVRRVYQNRRDVLVDALRRDIGEGLSFEVPGGGLALWARVAHGTDADGWATRAADRGVLLYSGRRYAFDRRTVPYLRLGFAAETERELREAVRRLASVRRG